MEIRKRRYGEIPENVKKQIREKNRKNNITPRNNSDAVFHSGNEEKASYFIEDKFSCSLYQIAEIKLAHEKVKRFKFADMFITTNKIWQGGLYYIKGDKIETTPDKELRECIVVINEASYHYKKVDGNEIYVGYVPNSSKTSTYLFQNDNLYLMDKDGHPDIPQNGYRLSEAMCAMPSHIEVFNETMNSLLSNESQIDLSQGQKLVRTNTHHRTKNGVGY